MVTPRKKIEEKLYIQIGGLLSLARSQIVNQVNQTMVLTYYAIGRLIVENEQDGKKAGSVWKRNTERVGRTII